MARRHQKRDRVGGDSTSAADGGAIDAGFVDEPIAPASLMLRIVNLIAILLPFVGLVVAVSLLWGVAFDWFYLVLFGVLYLLTGLGVTVGYHRFFTHKSFETSGVMKGVLGVLGSMAIEGPILEWVATHRSHHQHSDREDDPHSPHGHGTGLLAFVRGLVHAHCGWLVLSAKRGEVSRYAPDLQADVVTRRISKLFPLWAVLGLAIPTAIAFIVTGSWVGGLLGLLWGGLVRVFFVHHVTWSVNSICHLWGTRPFDSHDHSRNNPIVGVLAFGEGWHNNHHAFPTSARHGLRWWEIDTSYAVIKLMALMGLVKNVRVLAPERIAKKRARRRDGRRAERSEIRARGR